MSGNIGQSDSLVSFEVIPLYNHNLYNMCFALVNIMLAETFLLKLALIILIIVPKQKIPKMVCMLPQIVVHSVTKSQISFDSLKIEFIM